LTYTVPAGSLLILDDASAEAVDSATASMFGNPDIVPDVPVYIGLRTNPSGTIAFGSADHTIVGGVGLPSRGGRAMRGYAGPETDVLVLLAAAIGPSTSASRSPDTWSRMPGDHRDPDGRRRARRAPAARSAMGEEEVDDRLEVLADARAGGARADS
jgi:hypothetical protein